MTDQGEGWVKTLKPHSNTLGDKHDKKKGDVYFAGAHAGILLAAGLAENTAAPKH